jgi:hypothetical protein
MSITKSLLAGLVTAVVMTGMTFGARAAPLPTHVTAMKAITASDTVQVRWGWGGGWRGGWARGGWGYRGFGYRGLGYRGLGYRPLGWGAAAVGGALISGAYYGSYPYYGGGYAYQGCDPYGGGYGYGGYSSVYYASPYQSYGW